jgi:hypothetical protein
MIRRGIDFDIGRAGTDIRTNASWYTERLLRPLHRGRVLEAVRDTALSLSPTWRRELPRIQRTNVALAETVCEIFDRRLIIDSSKIGLRLKYLLRNPAFDIRVIRLIRDGRAVALTYVDPTTFANALDPKVRTERRGAGVSFTRAAREWRRANEEADHLLTRLDPARWIQVRYEDYCRDADGVLGPVYRFLGLAETQATRDFRAVEHHVIGNVMRRDTTTDIHLDERWRDVLTADQLAEFERIAGRKNRAYGYE